MKRSSGFLAAIFLAGISCGCTMCQNPYDYSGPVPGYGGGCPSCYANSGWRQGSAISGGPTMAAGAAQMAPSLQSSTTPEGAPQYQQGPQYQQAQQPTPAALR